MDVIFENFIWDVGKETANIQKHGVNFITAAGAFSDPRRKIYVDLKHSSVEERHFCVGRVHGRILTVRFAYRGDMVRIIGAGYWREGRQTYEKED
ncbi:MAG: hypothetical protein A3D28_02455 [Omnitrophica bacterium RIFCSPHIGHO2_02_FULL_63_14]|nr:MAG: hypothetical protein A3D28_02455 [Omnitrophica bacterium RIFCSPHIGHO2_02_FULL_63_14]